MEYFFKEVINLQTNKTRYYINGKRVNVGSFCLKSITCELDGFKYNSARTYEQNGKRYNVFYWNKTF
jgi:hypothetical protein